MQWKAQCIVNEMNGRGDETRSIMTSMASQSCGEDIDSGRVDGTKILVLWGWNRKRVSLRTWRVKGRETRMVEEVK